MSWDEGGRTAFESGWGAPAPRAQSDWGTQNNYRQPPPMMRDEYQETRASYRDPAPARSQYMATRDPTPMPKPAPRPVANPDYPDQDNWQSAYKSNYNPNKPQPAAQQQDKELFNYAQSRSTTNLREPQQQQQQRRVSPNGYPEPSNLGQQGALVIGMPKRKPRARKPVDNYPQGSIDLYAQRSHEDIAHRPKRRQVSNSGNKADIDLAGHRPKPVGPRYGLRTSTPPRRDTDLFGARGDDVDRFKVGGRSKNAEHHYGSTNGIFNNAASSKEHLPGRGRHARRVEPGIHQHTPLEWRE